MQIIGTAKNQDRARQQNIRMTILMIITREMLIHTTKEVSFGRENSNFSNHQKLTRKRDIFAILIHYKFSPKKKKSNFI